MSTSSIYGRIENLRLSLRQQITVLAVMAALIATVIVAILVAINERKASNSVSDEVNALTISRVERSAVKASDICDMAQYFLQKEADADLALARTALKEVGGVKEGGGSTTWNVLNQYTQQQRPAQITNWSFGGYNLKEDR